MCVFKFQTLCVCVARALLYLVCVCVCLHAPVCAVPQSVARVCWARAETHRRRVHVAATSLQCVWRGWVARGAYAALLADVITVQSLYRRRVACAEALYRRRVRAAAAIQSRWAVHRAVVAFQATKRHIAVIQRAVRSLSHTRRCSLLSSMLVSVSF